MPLIETKGAASAQGFGLTLGSSGPVTYIEDVFSTWIYTGNGSTQTITTGIDLAGKGGMLWIKSRSLATNNIINDTARGAGNNLMSNSTYFQFTNTDNVSALSSTGFSVGVDSNTNGTAGAAYASWTFRKQPKFFDVVTYTGDGVAGRTIAHSLGSVPGCIIVKCTSTTRDWAVYHRSLGATQGIYLNSSGAAFTSLTALWNGTIPTSTVFSVGPNTDVNGSGQTYVAYLFAHDAGGFGLSGTDNVISCGTFTTDGTGKATVTLGYEPQWIIAKRSNSAGDWYMADVMRTMPVNLPTSILSANLTAAEYSSVNFFSPTATGFLGSSLDSSAPFIYIAIRRGPMKVPTSGTSVFSPLTYSGNDSFPDGTDPNSGTSTRTISSALGFDIDMSMTYWRSGTAATPTASLMDRLRGVYRELRTYEDTVEAQSSNTGPRFSTRISRAFALHNYGVYQLNKTGQSLVAYAFSRAPGFFDEVFYTGDGVVNRVINHNLAKTPDLIISKTRDPSGNWRVCIPVFNNQVEPNKALYLDNGLALFDSYLWSAFSSTSITVASFSANQTNFSGSTYATYLFATCAGVSKVGSYTGTGALQTVNCGFTGGARFVVIKRTDSTGDWYVYDSARGISSGNDPYLFLDSTAAEVTGTNYVDTTSVGFQVTAAAPAGLNANGGTYIFLAIA